MASYINFNSYFLIFAFLAGVIPTLFWLWFWLQEDKKKPEPTRMIMKTFIIGGFSVVVALILEQLVTSGDNSFLNDIESAWLFKSGWFYLLTISFPLIIWALIEEIVKYFSAYVSAFKNRNFDEPVDAMIYLITASLGFAAVENFLFLLNVIMGENVGNDIFLMTGNLRFLGATILHTVSSAVLGAFIGFAFYQSRLVKFFAFLFGLIGATALHAGFNFLIIINNGQNILKILAILWIAVIILIFIFEVVKKISNKRKILPVR